MEVIANDPIVADNYFGSQDASLQNNKTQGQSFIAIAGILESAKFLMYKSLSPTGNAYAKIYAHSGTYGTSSLPTGIALATSDALDVSTLSLDSPALAEFTFSGANRITLTAGTNYCISIEYGSPEDYVFSVGDQSSPTHSGNYYCYDTKTSGWIANSGVDMNFYVYLTPTAAINPYNVTRDKAGDYSADANPAWKKGATVVNYKQSGDGGVYMTASESNAPYLSVFTHAGEPWTDLSTKLRIGNLNGYLGYSSDKYGIAIGEATKYLKYDPTNGLRIKGDIEATSGKFGTATNYWSVGATGLTAVAASTDVIINYGKTDFGQDATNGFILGGQSIYQMPALHCFQLILVVML